MQKLHKDVRNNILLECATSYPKVLEVVGISKWKEFKGLFMALLNHDDTIKLKIAGCLTRVAEVLGRELTETDLVPLVNKNLLSEKTPNNVKNEVILNLAGLLAVLDKAKREKYADIYSGLQSDPRKWRVREIIAGQLDILSSIF